jgi:hypothetical protein
MPNRPARFTETEIKRAVKAARKEGATEVVVEIAGQVTIRIRLRCPDEKNNNFADEEIIL